MCSYVRYAGARRRHGTRADSCWDELAMTWYDRLFRVLPEASLQTRHVVGYSVVPDTPPLLYEYAAAAAVAARSYYARYSTHETRGQYNLSLVLL